MDDFDLEKRIPMIDIAMEYSEDDEIFSFYVKKITNVLPLMSVSTRYSRVVFHVVRGLTRKSWIGRPKVITWNDVLNHTSFCYRTLAVPRYSTTVFNEFFSCRVEKALFHTTLLKVQFCDVSKDGNEDLGELEFSLTYLPTSQRVITTHFKVTNLKIDQRSTDIYVRTTLFVNEDFEEIHKTEHKKPLNEFTSCIVFEKKLVFDLMRSDLNVATMVFSVVEKIGERKRVIGQCGISYTSISRQWRDMIDSLRRPITEIHKLHPGV